MVVSAVTNAVLSRSDDSQVILYVVGAEILALAPLQQRGSAVAHDWRPVSVPRPIGIPHKTREIVINIMIKSIKWNEKRRRGWIRRRRIFKRNKILLVLKRKKIISKAEAGKVIG